MAGALASRFALALMTQRSGRPKRASLHRGTPPTEENRITEAGFVYETRGRGTSFWQVVDSTPGIAPASAADTKVYTEVDFTSAGANPSPAPASGTRIAALGIGYASRELAEGETEADLPYDILAWDELDQPWPAANKLLRFLEPGNANRDNDFPAPYIPYPAPSLAGRGGLYVDHSKRESLDEFGAASLSFGHLFFSLPTLSLFRPSRAARNNCDLVFSDTPHGAPHADWPLFPMGMVARFFAFGGTVFGGTLEDDALDIINAERLVLPSVATARTLPKYYQIRLASSAGRGIGANLRGKIVFWGLLGRCHQVLDEPDPQRAVGPDQSVIFPQASICVPVWPRYPSDDPYYFSPEPAAPLGLAVDASNPGEVKLTWDLVEGARGYLVQLTDDLSFGSSDYTCVTFKPEEVFYNLPSRPWAARVRATNGGGGSPWSDTVQFTPGATRDGISMLRVVETSPTSITWGWETPAEVDTCEVEWDGPTRGTVEVGRGSQDLWRHTIGELVTGTTVALRARSLGPNGVWDEWSDWVEGTAGVIGALDPPTNLRVVRRYTTRVDLEWDMPSGLTMSQLQVRYGAETSYRSPIPVVQRAGRSRASIPADPGTNLTIQVRSAETFESGPYSGWVPVPALMTSTLTGQVKPPTITDLTATGEIGHVALRWTQPENVRRAHIQWTEHPEGGSRGPQRQVIIGDDGEHNIYAPRGTLIRARVRASHGRNLVDPPGTVSGDWSEWVEATVIANIPVPTGLSATAGAGVVRFQWVLPDGIVRSDIAFQSLRAPDIFSGGSFGSRRITVVPPRYTLQVGETGYARARVRSVTADGHVSAWTDWTDFIQPTTRRDTGGDEGEVPSIPSLSVTTTINSLEATIGIANGATSYERSLLKGDGTWTAALSTTRAFTIEEDGDGDPLVGGTAYGLRVRARNSIGASAWVTGTFTTLLPIPDTPTVSATPGVTTVEFTASEETYATRVEYQREGSGGWPTAWQTAATQTFSVTGLTAATAYRYRFRSCNSAGCSTATIVSFTTQSVPVGPPPTVTAPGPVPSASTSRVTAASFRVTYGAAARATSHWRRFKKRSESWSGKAWSRIGGSGGGSFDLTDLNASTTYDVQVQGRNSAGSGTARSTSATTSAPPVTCPTELPTVSASSTASTATITFTTPARATRMQLRWRRSGGSYGPWRNVSSPHTISSLSASTTYNVQVRGWNSACGTTGGGPTRTINVTTTAAPVLPVTQAPSVSYVSTASSLTFSVTAVDNAESYQFNWLGQSTWHNFSGRSLAVPNVRSGSRYQVRFRGVNSAGQPGPASGYASGWTNPARPTLTVTAPSSSTVRVQIGAVTGASSYQRRHRKSGGSFSGWTTVGRDTTITGLDASSTYEVEARAVNAGGSSAVATGSATTGAAAPAAPALIVRTSSREGFVLPTGATVSATYPFNAWRLAIRYNLPSGRQATERAAGDFGVGSRTSFLAQVGVRGFAARSAQLFATVRRASDGVWSDTGRANWP